MFFRIMWATWRERRRPSTLEDFSAAMDEALERFPNDPVHLEARAQAALAVRDILGLRKYDA